MITHFLMAAQLSLLVQTQHVCRYHPLQVNHFFFDVFFSLNTKPSDTKVSPISLAKTLSALK